MNFIHETISYEQLKQTNSKDIDLIDEFVDVMLDVLLSKDGVVRINGEEKPRVLVQTQIKKIKYDEILLVLLQFKQQKKKIQKKTIYAVYALPCIYGEKCSLYKLG